MEEVQKYGDKGLQIEGKPSNLIALALQNNANIETLERLMALQERWEMQQAKKKFAKAFSKFQSEVPEIPKSKKVSFKLKTGGVTEYFYAPLSTIIKIIQPFLKKYGFSFRWEFEDTDKEYKCTIFLTHQDGHTETSTMTAPADESGKKNAIQQIGSTRTYLQRYTLIAVLGLTSADEDDDTAKQRSGLDLLNEEINQLKKEGKLNEEKKKLRDKYVKLGLDKVKVTQIIAKSLPKDENEEKKITETKIIIDEFTDYNELGNAFPNIIKKLKAEISKAGVQEVENHFQKKYSELKNG